MSGGGVDVAIRCEGDEQREVITIEVGDTLADVMEKVGEVLGVDEGRVVIEGHEEMAEDENFAATGVAGGDELRVVFGDDPDLKSPEEQLKVIVESLQPPGRHCVTGTLPNDNTQNPKLTVGSHPVTYPITAEQQNTLLQLKSCVHQPNGRRSFPPNTVHLDETFKNTLLPLTNRMGTTDATLHLRELVIYTNEGGVQPLQESNSNGVFIVTLPHVGDGGNNITIRHGGKKTTRVPNVGYACCINGSDVDVDGCGVVLVYEVKVDAPVVVSSQVVAVGRLVELSRMWPHCFHPMELYVAERFYGKAPDWHHLSGVDLALSHAIEDSHAFSHILISLRGGGEHEVTVTGVAGYLPTDIYKDAKIAAVQWWFDKTWGEDCDLPPGDEMSVIMVIPLDREHLFTGPACREDVENGLSMLLTADDTAVKTIFETQTLETFFSMTSELTQRHDLEGRVPDLMLTAASKSSVPSSSVGSYLETSLRTGGETVCNVNAASQRLPDVLLRGDDIQTAFIAFLNRSCSVPLKEIDTRRAATILWFITKKEEPGLVEVMQRGVFAIVKSFELEGKPYDPWGNDNATLENSQYKDLSATLKYLLQCVELLGMSRGIVITAVTEGEERFSTPFLTSFMHEHIQGEAESIAISTRIVNDLADDDTHYPLDEGEAMIVTSMLLDSGAAGRLLLKKLHDCWNWHHFGCLDFVTGELRRSMQREKLRHAEWAEFILRQSVSCTAGVRKYRMYNIYQAEIIVDALECLHSFDKLLKPKKSYVMRLAKNGEIRAYISAPWRHATELLDLMEERLKGTTACAIFCKQLHAELEAVKAPKYETLGKSEIVRQKKWMVKMNVVKAKAATLFEVTEESGDESEVGGEEREDDAKKEEGGEEEEEEETSEDSDDTDDYFMG